ncbi:hypothetical protein [Sediminitomix flava]|uniref:DUF4382 domain-containing protein n=1 Tax=Sediminitomix flava TaxID=379075 RepID=A0A315ZDU5_SEDFL|nr:hypothetical protein [Sediminitomix flava]PWJ43711.1 hypothetical protein BC781_10157 [Sediminitomix flava]
MLKNILFIISLSLVSLVCSDKQNDTYQSRGTININFIQDVEESVVISSVLEYGFIVINHEKIRIDALEQGIDLPEGEYTFDYMEFRYSIADHKFTMIDKSIPFEVKANEITTINLNVVEDFDGGELSLEVA